MRVEEPSMRCSNINSGLEGRGSRKAKVTRKRVEPNLRHKDHKTTSLTTRPSELLKHVQGRSFRFHKTKALRRFGKL